MRPKFELASLFREFVIIAGVLMLSCLSESVRGDDGIFPAAPAARPFIGFDGKGFLLHDFRESVPGLEVAGIAISTYGIQHTMEDVKPFCQVGTAAKLPYPDKHFDLVISITTLHNLYNYGLHAALGEIERVGRGAKYICVEAYRNEREKVNLMYWQLTCRAFHTPEEWDFVFKQSGYTGDHEFIFFE